jgi:hypothetical protein
MNPQMTALALRCLYLAMGVSMSLCLPNVAGAATVGISEGENFISLSISGAGETGPTPILSVVLENVGILAQADAHFEYISSTTPVPQAGSTSTTNYNIFEPTLPLTLSDTLNIAITWRQPTTDDLNNVIVDIHFRSDSLDGILPALLTDAFSIVETGQAQTVDTVFGVSDLTVQFQSDVEATPLPAALPLFASGGGLLGLLSWRRKRKQAAAIV